MASRAAQKQAARERRLALEREHAERAARQRRIQMVGGVVLVAVAVIAVAIAISSGGGGSPPKLNSAAATQAAGPVDGLFAGVPQTGTTHGSPTAKVTVTEFGDLKCPVCKDFALGPQNQLISNDVRSGKVKLVYRSLCTATCSGPQPSVFGAEQAAAYAAGLQGKGWYYIELFYHLQGDETASYVDSSFLDGIARLVPGLNYSKWLADSQSAALKSQVSADQAFATAHNWSATPTVTIQGPKGSAQPIIGGPGAYSDYETAIQSVS
jgi:protein-disulfide isomerase